MSIKEPIREEQTELDDFEIGGAQFLSPSIIDRPLEYDVKNAGIKNTEWGKRIDYDIVSPDGLSQWQLSSWNILAKKKFKASDIIGKRIRLSPVKDNEKKLLLEVL